MDAWLRLDREVSAARLTFKSLNGSAGVGTAQLLVTIEVASRKAIADNRPLWLCGSAYAQGIGRGTGYLGTLRTLTQPVTLPERGGTSDVPFYLDLSYAQLQELEEHRNGSVRLAFDFSGYWLFEGEPKPFSGARVETEASQSDWIRLLEHMQYRRIMLVELDFPDSDTAPEYVVALDFFAEAQKHYLSQEWRLTVESLRQSLAALVGKKVEDEDFEADVQAELKGVRKSSASQRVGWHERYGVVRTAMKFMCDLGAHPEAAETTKRDAHAALMMTAGLLRGFVRS